MIETDATRLPATPESPQPRDAVVFGLMCVALGLFNFLILPIVRVAGESNVEPVIILFVSLAFGVYAAELAILTLALVCGPGSFLWRLAVHWVIAMGLYVAWALGLAAGFGSEARQDELPKVWAAMLCVLPLVSLAAQLPLWPLRIYFGWRIERWTLTPDVGGHSPLLIRDLMAGTVITSVSLATLRLIPGEVLGNFNDGPPWLGGAIMFVSVLGISVFSLPPAMLFLLRMQGAATAALAWFSYTAVAMIGTLVVVSSLMGSGPPSKALTAFVVVFFSFAGTVSLSLFIARARGYRLIFLRDRRLPVDHAPSR